MSFAIKNLTIEHSNPLQSNFLAILRNGGEEKSHTISFYSEHDGLDLVNVVNLNGGNVVCRRLVPDPRNRKEKKVMIVRRQSTGSYSDLSSSTIKSVSFHRRNSMTSRSSSKVVPAIWYEGHPEPVRRHKSSDQSLDSQLSEDEDICDTINEEEVVPEASKGLFSGFTTLSPAISLTARLGLSSMHKDNDVSLSRFKLYIDEMQESRDLEDDDDHDRRKFNLSAFPEEDELETSSSYNPSKMFGLLSQDCEDVGLVSFEFDDYPDEVEGRTVIRGNNNDLFDITEDLLLIILLLQKEKLTKPFKRRGRVTGLGNLSRTWTWNLFRLTRCAPRGIHPAPSSPPKA